MVQRRRFRTVSRMRDIVHRGLNALEEEPRQDPEGVVDVVQGLGGTAVMCPSADIEPLSDDQLQIGGDAWIVTDHEILVDVQEVA